MREQPITRRAALAACCAATMTAAEYRRTYMALWPGCKGYCVAGTGGDEPDTGKCPFCGYERPKTQSEDTRHD